MGNVETDNITLFSAHCRYKASSSWQNGSISLICKPKTRTNQLSLTKGKVWYKPNPGYKDLHRNRFLKIPSHNSTPSSTCEAISGGMTGDGGPIIRSSPTRMVSSIIGCESIEKLKLPILLFHIQAKMNLLMPGFKKFYHQATSNSIFQKQRFNFNANLGF